IYVGAGDATDSIVYWPDLQGDGWKALAADSKNILTDKKHAAWHSVMRQAAPGEAYVIYKMDAPQDIVRLVYGGRIYNYGAGLAAIEHSFDGGQTWGRRFSCPGVREPHHVLRYATI